MLADQAPDHAAARRLGFKQFDCIFEAEARGVGPLLDGGVDLAVIDVGAEAARLHADFAPFRVLAKFAPRAGAKARPAGPALLRHDEVDRPIGADLEHVVVAAKVGVGLAVLHIGTVAADAGEDRLAAGWMARHFTGQSEQRQRLFERHVVAAQALRQRRSLGLLALALLDVLAKAPAAQSDLLAGRRVLAKHTHARPVALGGLRARRRQDARVLALGVARAADEGAKLAELQRQLAFVAERAEAWVDPLAARGKNVGTQKLVQAVEHLARAEILDVADGAGEIVPEVAQERLPIDLAVRDLVELLFQIGGEIVTDVFGEERFEEGRDNPALVLRKQALLLDPHVVAILEHRDGRGVGRRAADAELLHPLDQRRLGVAGRRLGEVLARVDPLLGKLLALAHRGQTARLFVFVVVPPLLVESEETWKAHHLAGRAKFELARAGLSQNVDRRSLELRALHLASDRARPDEFVELRLLGLEVARDVARALRHVGRADRFVRLLCVLGFGGVFSRRGRHVIVAEILGDDAARRRNRLGREIDAVSSHVGNETGRAVADVDAFVEALCNLHGARRRKTELPRRLLLQGRSGERRIWVTLDGLRFDRGDREERLLKRRLEGFPLRARADV